MLLQKKIYFTVWLKNVKGKTSLLPKLAFPDKLLNTSSLGKDEILRKILKPRE